MARWKMIAIVILLVGLGTAFIGIRQVYQLKVQNTCVVGFTKSLGGRASFELRESLHKQRNRAIMGIFLGGIGAGTGAILLFYLKK
ncbi:hypothetical protein SAMN05660420_03161 [Desulfuromusa kysingii]|uniref:Uncharacterized protein n=1 Tax=Desulfuromusa kysingii TaxID=37625 RepID=A0A1H4DZK0_9BACT|nr:hypothetical protein [Desulfuromusa kysingii]SEA77997.1 hypothetical protein SAMN05660420_03161 [Desulfuromusa kysingii]